MANILLDKTHKPLIKAATSIGDWILSFEQLSAADRQAVISIQQALANLPKLNDGTLAMYGFSLEQGDENEGLVRGWDVSLEYFADDSEQQGGLELFSSYITIPETNNPEVLALKKQSEAYFHWPIGDVCNLVQAEQARKWIDEVADPLTHKGDTDRLRVEIVYADYYAELELDL